MGLQSNTGCKILGTPNKFFSRYIVITFEFCMLIMANTGMQSSNLNGYFYIDEGTRNISHYKKKTQKKKQKSNECL